jgi:hypothetical protein
MICHARPFQTDSEIKMGSMPKMKNSTRNLDIVTK